MVWPRVSILWLNYNSMGIAGIVEESLRAIGDLDYPDYELVIVDNGSTDGSYRLVRSLAERLPVRKKVIRLERNLGFTGGNNVAFRARDRESKYVVLLNNDAVPYPESLRLLVEHIESMDGVASLQGVIVDPRTGRVDTAGDMVSELFTGYPLYQGYDPAAVLARHKNCFTVTYATGAYSLHSVEAVKRVMGGERLFYDEGFAYFDDDILGLEYWDAGYKVASCPVLAGLHYRSMTFKRVKPVQVYLVLRKFAALNEMSNTRFKQLMRLRVYRVTLINRIARILGVDYKGDMADPALAWRAYVDGVKLGRKILRQRGRILDIYKAPIIRVPLLEALTGLGLDYLRRLQARREAQLSALAATVVVKTKPSLQL